MPKKRTTPTMLQLLPEAFDPPDRENGDIWYNDALGKFRKMQAGVTSDLDTTGAGGSIPTGTGFRHITAGVEDAAAKLVDTADVNADQITYAKIQNVSATDNVLGRSTAGAGDVEEIPCTAAGRALIDDADAAAQRTTLGLGALAVKSTVATADIDADAVTYARLQNISAASRFLGRITAGAGDAEELTGTQATTLLDAFTSTLKGVAPASGGGTTNFLRADGTWAPPPAGGGGAVLTRINAASGAAGADITWQKLAANSADTTSVTPAAVMTTTGVGVGTWHFRYVVLYQTAATTTGVKFNVNHTGTTGQFASHWRQLDTLATASSGVGDDVTGAAAGGCGSGYAETVKNTSTVASVGVSVANTDIMATIEGLIVVTATGSLELKFATEVAGSAARVTADSLLMLSKIG